MTVDENGVSYRERLLKAILLLHEKVARDGKPEIVVELHGLLKDLHDLEYRVAVDAEQELRGELAKLLARVDQLEAFAGIRRMEGIGPPPNRGHPSQGRIA
jgi:hypothetical protein